MDWPHDPDGEEGSEGRRNYGHAILAKKLDEEEDFPLTAEEYVEETEYEDFPEFHKAVGAALRAADLWPYRLEHA